MFFWLVNLGQRAELGDWTLGLDLSNATMMEGDLAYGLTIMPSVAFTLSEKIDFFAKGGFETFLAKDDGFSDNTCWMAGAGMNWHPVENLRLHALAAYNELWDCTSVSVGATYYLNFGK